jgi:hypothetical protein
MLFSILPIFKCYKGKQVIILNKILFILNKHLFPPQTLMSVKHLGSAWTGVVWTLTAPTDVNASPDWQWVWMDVCVLVRNTLSLFVIEKYPLAINKAHEYQNTLYPSR